MKNNKTVLYVVIGILAVALLGGIMDLTKKDETSVSATNILNNTKATSIFANSSAINKIKENVVEKEETNEEKIEQVSKEESKDTEKNSSNSSNEKTTVTEEPKQENTSQKETSNTSNQSTSTSSSNTNKTNNKTTTSSSSSSSVSNASTSDDETSETVWVGNTGTKYHRQSCRTLKGKGHKITLKEALAEGREPCKVCKP